MEEGLKGILMGAVLVAFIMAMALAKDAVNAGSAVLEKTEERMINERSVILLWQSEEEGG